MVNVPSTAQTLSNDYTGLGTWIGLASMDGSNPTGPPLEVPPQAAGYQRMQTHWTSQGGGVNVGTQVTLSAPAGEYTFVILQTESDPSQAGDALIDYCPIDAILNTDGQIEITPTYTQT
jgi:hypothetical protein